VELFGPALIPNWPERGYAGMTAAMLQARSRTRFCEGDAMVAVVFFAGLNVDGGLRCGERASNIPVRADLLETEDRSFGSWSWWTSVHRHFAVVPLTVFSEEHGKL